jgi:hypothetical protein
MKFEDFKASLTTDSPPTGLSAPLAALWYDANGDWEMAHQTVQSESGKAGAWVHAYLHRKEGDESNARYWYAHARKKKGGNLEQEWEEIVKELLENE